MRRIIVLISLFILINDTVAAQEASLYMPPLHSAWTIQTQRTLEGQTIGETSRRDSLTSIYTGPRGTEFVIVTSDTVTYTIETNIDTLFIRIEQILASELFDENLIELEVDPLTRLPIAVLSADEFVQWDIIEHTETIVLTDTLKSFFPDNVTIDDEADINIRVRGNRLSDTTASFGVGILPVSRFESLIEVNLTLYVRIGTLRVGVPFTVIDNLALQHFIAEGYGIVRQTQDEYDVYIRNETFNVNTYVFTVPSTHAEMTEFSEGTPTTIADKEMAIPRQFELWQNYPNPFNPITIITYTIPRESYVTLRIYNLLGAEVGTLVNSHHQKGRYHITFDASELPSGTYFYTLRADDFYKTKRMILSK